MSTPEVHSIQIRSMQIGMWIGIIGIGADHTTVAVRKHACTDRKEAGRRRHRDHKTHSYVSDLLLDQGCQIYGSAQAAIGAAFGNNKKHRKVHGQDARKG